MFTRLILELVAALVYPSDSWKTYVEDRVVTATKFYGELVELLCAFPGILVYFFARDPRIYRNTLATLDADDNQSPSNDTWKPLKGEHEWSTRGGQSDSKWQSAFSVSFLQGEQTGEHLDLSMG